LPNLDFKIEQGDSLTAPAPQGALQLGLYGDRLKEYMRLKDEFMKAHGPEKPTLRQQVEEIRSEIAAWVRTEGPVAGFDWPVGFAEVFLNGGFDVVLANPPYVRIDAQFKHIRDEETRNDEIKAWKEYCSRLSSSRIYSTLYEKWDLFIPFLERAHQLLHQAGQMVFIVSDAYNRARYTRLSHEFFLKHSTIERIDFRSDIPLFEAGVRNTILHFEKSLPEVAHCPMRVRRWGERPDEFDLRMEHLSSKRQIDWGDSLFQPEDKERVDYGERFPALRDICYISKGMVIHADERKAHMAFKVADLVSATKDTVHSKPFVEGKGVAKWLPSRVNWLEYGTSRAPALFSRPTFPELHQATERLLAFRMSGSSPVVAFDDSGIMSNHTVIIFVPWHALTGVRNRSIQKVAKYKSEQLIDGGAPSREDLESTSRRFAPKYLLAVMNSTVATEWLAAKRKGGLDIYPDEWKPLPIAPASPAEQATVVARVDRILSLLRQHSSPLPADAQRELAALEKEVDDQVTALYQQYSDGKAATRADGTGSDVPTEPWASGTTAKR
jgi:hypothetical protein